MRVTKYLQNLSQRRTYDFSGHNFLIYIITSEIAKAFCICVILMSDAQSSISYMYTIAGMEGWFITLMQFQIWARQGSFCVCVCLSGWVEWCGVKMNKRKKPFFLSLLASLVINWCISSCGATMISIFALLIFC